VTAQYALDGIRCLEFSHRGPAAYAGKMLRRLGATVVKAEGPSGDPLRQRFSRRAERDGRVTTPAFDFFNEGKTSVLVASGDDLRQRIAQADVFICDLPITQYERWGLSVAELDALPCRLVAALTPFGLTGPYASYQGSELTASAFGGTSMAIGERGRPPLKMPLMQTAIQAGLMAAIGVAGFFADPADGTTVLDISETDVWATIHTGTTVVAYLFSNQVRRRSGRRVAGLPFPHQLFRCKDGWISIQASEREQYRQFMDMVGSPEWAEDRRYGSRVTMAAVHGDEVDALLAPWFMDRTREEIFAECRRRRIPAAPVQSIREVRNDERLAEAGAFETYTGGAGVSVTVPAPPFRFRDTPVCPPGDVPARPTRTARTASGTDDLDTDGDGSDMDDEGVTDTDGEDGK
jgi:crotonobetainyl-CoA:carnitine CoA-transferase CaiB-like acyl-CoA transferase